MSNRAVFLGSDDNGKRTQVYDSGFYEQMDGILEFMAEPVNHKNIESFESELRDVEIAFSTWGVPRFTEEEIKRYLPKLRVLFYGAGSVQTFARPFMACGVTVVSAWAANAVPVAEYTAAQIVLANKGFFRSAAMCKSDHLESRMLADQYPGNYGAKVGILGAGMIGSMVIERLQAYRISVEVFDPYLSEERAAKLGVVKSELVDLFANCHTISNHLANLPATVGILNKEHFDRMMPYATFINTGRGAQVVEPDLIRALREVPTRTALLDVTYPEPVRRDSELLQLDNVILTPHIAGSMSREVARMGLYMADECKRYLNGEALKFNVTYDMLETMA
ncbi:MAG: D-isomer specific 2-hydroxyacid dehydrogenase NAD-binding protein [Paenibacillus sp.]|uniref:hydroxyacid dehydrogenase n=1 Tax=unclassified Paenibacillus TaxID=185978 RepID=UPI0029EE1AAF|nr:D-isomer specific 2-hydroxyacid dehydrogenase NAD-binding protein [Paenibacillus sp.]